MAETYRETLDGSDVNDSQTLEQGNWKAVAELAGDRTDAYTFGSNNYDSRSGNGYADMTDSAGNALEGKFRVVTYRSSRRDEVKAARGVSGLGNSYEFPDFASVDPSDRTSWANFPTHRVAAGDSEVVVLEAKVGSTNDGNTIDVSSSDFHIPVTRIR